VLVMKPTRRPERPFFSSGPCAKRPGWNADGLKDAVLGRSHRSKPGKAKLAEVIERSKQILGLPDDYRLGLLVGSNTAAIECALWSLLGPRGVDVLAWDAFGHDWVTDVVKQLGLDAQVHEADYGALPDLDRVDFASDVVFTWNGTTAGVRVPNADWIPTERQGLTICDATSAVFAMDLDWSKLDAVTWSWQKVIGGEAGHGMLALSPRAVERLESHTPTWPMPKIFRLTQQGKINEGIFEGSTINTPSLLCVEDALDALGWIESLGGLEASIARSQANLAAITEWVDRTDWVDFLARNAATRSSTSVCLRLADPAVAKLSDNAQTKLAKRLAAMLEAEGVAFDIGSYRSAPPGLRLWGGASVERADLEALFPWLDWAWEEVRTR
jgi:phosphoserine aminotransferase